MAFSPSEIRTILIGAMLAIFISAIDQSIVATALPTMARELGDFSLISWVVTAYLLTATAVMPIVGKLSDLYGRRVMLIGCLSLFMAASVFCALAPNMICLILARALQGLGGGGLTTLAQTIIADLVSPRERGKYQAYFSATWATAALLGPSVGGLLTEFVGWPWIFWINLPVCAIALLLSERVLRKLAPRRQRSHIDFPGIFLLTAFTVALLMVVSLGGKQFSWSSIELLSLAGVTLVAGLLFVFQEKRSPEAILPPRFLGDKVIRPVLLSSGIVHGCYLSCSILVPIYFQLGLGLPASVSGIFLIPLAVSTNVTTTWAATSCRRTGHYKKQPLIGLAFSATACALLAFFAQGITPLWAAILLSIIGLGLGPIFPCTLVAAQNAVDQKELGAVSGVVTFSRALGSAVGIAASSSLVLSLIAGARPEMSAAESLEDLLRFDLGPEAQAAVLHAFGIVFWVLAAAFVAGLAVYATVEDRVLRGGAGTATSTVKE